MANGLLGATPAGNHCSGHPPGVQVQGVGPHHKPTSQASPPACPARDRTCAWSMDRGSGRLPVARNSRLLVECVEDWGRHSGDAAAPVAALGDQISGNEKAVNRVNGPFMDLGASRLQLWLDRARTPWSSGSLLALCLICLIQIRYSVKKARTSTGSIRRRTTRFA